MKKLIISLIVVMATFASSFAYTHGGISARLYAIDYSNTYGVSTETYYLGSSPTIVYYTLRTNTWGSTASVKNYNTTIDYIVGIDDGVVTQKTSYVA
ncbi:MAG: hypothetical protein KAQ75_08295, partial [Bacteroidales bacterium]|nr:hypothetical protein [Bacteroidales bacterium]